MLDALAAWRETVNEVRRTDGAIGLALAGGPNSGISSGSEWRRLDEELRPAERAARRRLTDVIAEELAAR